jgi:2-methylcitrate dehydratase PrpD
MTTIIEDLARWAHRLRYEDLPARIRTKARLQTLSVIGACHAAHHHEIGKTITAAVSAWAGPGPCTLIPSGKKAGLLSAVWANTAHSVALDFDDYLLFGHTGHSAVMVPLAAAEHAGAAFPVALTAQVIANEIEGRMGAAVVLGPHNGQAWSHIHLIGSAAAAAKVFGLTEKETAHALAIALYQPTYLLMPGFMGPDSKATTASTPSVTGVQAALFAKAGATGPLDIIEHPQGFLARFAFVPSPWFLTGFGKSWVTDTLAYKIYPGCAYIDTAVDAVLKIREQFADETGAALNPDDIKDVLVEATVLTLEMDNLSRTGGTFDPQSPISINFSIPGSLALALLHGRLDARALTRESLAQNAEAIRKIADKVRLEHDWALTIRFLEAMDQTLNFRELLAEIDLKKLAGVRARIQGQYHSSMGFSLDDLKEILNKAPQVKSRVLAFLSRRLSGAVFGHPGGRERYDLGRAPLDRFTMPFAARVSVTLQNGKVLAASQETPFGGPGHPLDNTAKFVINKYRSEAGRGSADADVKKIIESADEIETRFTVSEFIARCRVKPDSP